MLSRRRLLAGLFGTIATDTLFADITPFGSDSDKSVFRIGFGSCVSQRRDQTIWEIIAARNPDVFVMMGDGVYPEHEGEDLPVLESIEKAYQHARTRTELAAFREQIETIAIWDDNDYGGSDIGASFTHKCTSRDLFLDFWANEKESEVRRRNDGIYGLWEFGPEEQRTQIIVPDLRFCRSEWAQTELDIRAKLGQSGFGPYKPTASEDTKMLGDQQWRWLEECLSRPAKFRILVSSIQFVAEGRGWESWSNFPHEKARLLELIRATRAENLLIISGDTHYGEVSLDNSSLVGYPLWEITSSGLTESWPTPGPNPNRIGPAYPTTNFGMLSVNWASNRPMIVAELFSGNGARLRQQSLFLDDLALG
jgi:alkaline phosphatase D